MTKPNGLMTKPNGLRSEMTPSQTTPSAHLLVGDLAARGRDDLGDNVAIIDGAETVSYAQLAERAYRLAGRLIDQGLRAGDRLALIAPNSVAVFETVFAASLVGVTVVPMNLRLRPEDMRFQADDADVRFAVIDPAFEALAREAGIAERPHWIAGEPLRPADTATDLARVDAHRPGADSVLIQLYTSGTTGRSKGCLLTQRGWLSQVAGGARLLGLTASDVVTTPLPFFHVAGLHLALSTLGAGATLAIAARADVGSLWDVIDEHRVTVAQTIGGYRAFLRSRDVAGSSLRGIFGGNIGPADVLDALPPAFEVWTGYGATELCGYAAGHNRASFTGKSGTMGTVMSSFLARAVDDEGRPVPTGQVGELLMRGPSVTTGYWNLAEATAETLRDGWLHTGDLVQFDDAGVMRFVDRLKDMVKPGGENVYCVEVEEALAGHPAVRECAVIGVADKRWGEAVKAVVATRSAVTPEQLDEWCLSRLAPFKRPRWYEFVDALPRNALNKVVKTQLRAAHDPARAARLPERAS